jgi:hypothetical protein
MKYAIAAVAVVACIAGGALAQAPLPVSPVGAPPASTAPVPPSACPAYPAAPTLPAAESLKRGRAVDQKKVNAGTEVVNAWITQYQTVGACRRDEVVKLDAQVKARVEEFNAGNARATQIRNEWQATVDSLMASQQKKK